MASFIPLGYHCNITFLQQDLCIKHETGLFEWLESRYLQCITDIINIIKDNIDLSIIRGVDGNIRVLHDHVFTYHYKLEEYKLIFERRAKRMLDKIRNSEELLFVRINPYGRRTSETEINNFCDAIRSINPDVRIKFLMIHTIDDTGSYVKLDETQIPGIIFLQKEFLQRDCSNCVYLRDNKKIQGIFLEYLAEIGYTIPLSTETTYNDKD